MMMMRILLFISTSIIKFLGTSNAIHEPSALPSDTRGTVKPAPLKRKQRTGHGPQVGTSRFCYNTLYSPHNRSGIAWGIELINASRKWSQLNAIVITGGDWAYRGTMLNWMAHAENVGMTQYIVLCYGKDMLELVGSWEDRGHGILVQQCSRIVEYMFMKLMGLYHLNSAGFIATWSDADALWLQPRILDDWIHPYNGKVDFLSQKGLHPKEISVDKGSTMCTGLFTIFPSDKVAREMAALMLMMRDYGVSSDQQLVNTFLFSRGAFQFTEIIEYDDEDSPQVVTIPKYKNSSSPVIGFLPSGIFPRSQTNIEWGYVHQKYAPALWHSKAQRKGLSKVEGMVSSSVFALKAGWANITKAFEVPKFIDTVLLKHKNWTQAAFPASNARSFLRPRSNLTGTSWNFKLLKVANKWSRLNGIVVTGGTFKNRGIVLNWMAHAENVGMTQYIVLCYGKDMLELVGSWEDGGHGILVLIDDKSNLYDFMKIVSMYLLHKAGFVVTWSDADALWLRPHIHEDWILPFVGIVDFLVQKSDTPDRVMKMYGSAVSTSFLSVFPSNRTNDIVNLFTNLRVNYAKDLNLLFVTQLEQFGAFYPFLGTSRVVFDDHKLKQTIDTRPYRNGKSIRVGFLPGGMFFQKTIEDKTSYVQKQKPAVWYAVPPKGKTIITVMKEALVFILNDKWEKIRTFKEIASAIDKSAFDMKAWHNTSILAGSRPAVTFTRI